MQIGWLQVKSQLELSLAQLSPSLFIQCLRTFITPCKKICFQHVWRHVHTIFENMLTKYMKTIYTTFGDLFTLCFKVCLHYVWRHIFKMFEVMFIQGLHQVGGLFTKCLKPYSLKNYEIVPFVENYIAPYFFRATLFS